MLPAVFLRKEGVEKGKDSREESRKSPWDREVYRVDEASSKASRTGGRTCPRSLWRNIQYGTIANGNHTISIAIRDNNSNYLDKDYSFSVSDSLPPQISLKHNSSDANNTVIKSLDNKIEFSAASDEFAYIKYSLNGDDYSGEIDMGQQKALKINLTLAKGNNIL